MLTRRRRRTPVRSGPIITLTTDFGTSDAYVAVMKARICGHCADARLIDVTHHVPPQDVPCGSITLERAVDGFPPGTIHLAVVDPGVGTDRRILVVEINRQRVVCPDNGLITWSWRLHAGGRAHELTWRPPRLSDTFHGRDVMAPAVGMLASGTALRELAARAVEPALLDLAPAPPGEGRGRVIHVDHFGNATTNIAAELLRDASGVEVRVRGRRVRPLRLKRTYWDVAPGKPLALIGSAGLLEIAVRDGSAAEQLKIRVGDEVELR